MYSLYKTACISVVHISGNTLFFDSLFEDIVLNWSNSEGFCRWYVTICKTVLLDFSHCINYKIIKLKRFGR